jgi:hypothetical protein
MVFTLLWHEGLFARSCVDRKECERFEWKLKMNTAESDKTLI